MMLMREQVNILVDLALDYLNDAGLLCRLLLAGKDDRPYIMSVCSHTYILGGSLV